MCAVSNIGDHYQQQWPSAPTVITQTQSGGPLQFQIGPTRYEFDELKREVSEMKRLLINAKEIDEKIGNSDCEMEGKIKILKDVAKAVGVNLEDIFKK